MGIKQNVVLCALVLGFLGSVNARGLAQAGASCEAASFLEIIVTDGTCSGRAQVTCDAQAESESAIKVAVEEWFADDHSKLCVQESINAAAFAVGRAVARLYASALAEVECSEKAVGSACGWSFGQGSAWAVATAKAIAIAVADFGPERALCETDITALSGVFVDVAGRVAAVACLTGPGSASDNEELYLESIQNAIADAFAYASAEFCNFGSDVLANSECSGQGTSTSDGSDTSEGTGSGGTSGGRFPACTGAGDAKCCKDSRSRRRGTCNCRDCNGPWFRVQRQSETGLDVWRDLSDNLCFCA